MTRGAISDLPPERPLMATRGTGTRFLCYGQNQVERELHMISAPKHHGTGHMPVGREYALLTLDVFDTCLIRDFIGQESLWYLLGAEIMKQLPGVPSEADFVRLRGDSENYARSQSTAEDIKLAQVYERLGALCGWDTARQQQAIRLEEEFEARCLQPNPAAHTLLAKAQEARVAYLSDTPHRGAFIEKCLGEHSLPAGPVLSSGDLGRRKGTGSLFREAMRRLAVERGQILHVGNDLRPDGAGSARAGVAFAPIFAANPTRYELTLDSARGQAGGLIGPALAGSGRHFRLAEERDDRFPPALVSLISGVAGPTIFAAAAWSLLSAQEDERDILYFVARDGEILLAAAKLLQQELGLATGIECRYLYGSRRAWHLPTLSMVPADEVEATLRRLLIQSGKVTLDNLLAQLDLDVEVVASVAPEAVSGIPAHTPLGEQLIPVIDALVGSPRLRTLALSRARAAHSATVAYLRQEKVFDGGRVGLVDIGWHGAASASLVSIAAAQGTHVLCYFAGGLCGPKSTGAPPDSRAYLIDARGEETEFRRSLVHLLETFCAGSGGSTLGYQESAGRWVPRLASADTNPATLWGLSDYQGLVRGYVGTACQIIGKYEMTVTRGELLELRSHLMGNLRELWYHPTQKEAEAWGSFPFEGDARSEMLGAAPTARDVIGYVLHLTNKAKRPRFGVWNRAVIARTRIGRTTSQARQVLRIGTAGDRAMLLARVRCAVTPRPEGRSADIDVRNGKITIQRQTRCP
jgi:FMN phosphatase YigB (HAD superfamily)